MLDYIANEKEIEEVSSVVFGHSYPIGVLCVTSPEKMACKIPSTSF